MAFSAHHYNLLTVLFTIITRLCLCSAQTLEAKDIDTHKKCSEWEERHCIQGSDKFHYCTTITAEEWKVRLFGPHQSKLFCECREGFSVPLRQAYVEGMAPSTDCVPCQEESLVYFGFNIQGSDPMTTTLTIDECREECFRTPACNFWTYNRAGQKCYLKTRRGEPTVDTKYISGLKNCTGPKHFLERKDLTSTLPLLEMFHPTGERSVLQGVPAMFGPRLAGDFTILGYLSGSHLEDKLCENFPPDFKPRGEFAIARRGHCAFLQKTQVAQLAGFKGVIILDDDSDTKFHRIIAAKEDLLKASFIKIPTLFLRKKETEIFQDLIKTGKNFLARISGSDSFSPIRDGPDVRFPEEELDNQIISMINATISAPSDPSSDSQNYYRNDGGLEIQDNGFSPVAIVFIASTSGLVALALIAVLAILCRKIYLKRNRRARDPARCQGSAESNTSNGTIFQTVSSGNTGSLEALARWIGSDNFQTAGSDSAEMAVILSSVECPVCYEAIWPPKKIFQCTKGHILCETCLGNPYFDQRCPSCRESFTSIKPSRNLALENLFSSVLHLATLSMSSKGQIPAEIHHEGEPEISAVPSSPSVPVPSAPSISGINHSGAHSNRFLPSAPSLEELI